MESNFIFLLFGRQRRMESKSNLIKSKFIRFKDEVIQTHNVLYFNSAIQRDRAGEYLCEATNR